MNRSSRIELALNVLAFATVIIVCGTYLATQAYHWKPLQDTKTAYVSLTDSNLILEDTGVFVSGIRIGKVADVRIKPDGATLVLEYDADNSLPADSVLSIGLQSALGEPYLNFTPGTSGGPSLKNGATIAAENLEEPESIPGIFNQISTMSSVFDAGPMSGILKSFAEALDGTEGSLDRITDGTRLVATMLMTHSPQMRKMFSNTQVYTADLDWIVKTLPQFSGGLHDIIVTFLSALEATGDLVDKGHLNSAMRDSVQPFFAKLNPYLADIIPPVMDAIGPLMPIAFAIDDTVPQIDMSAFLAQALELLGGGDGVKLVISQPN
ncbi:MlaD family protein [Gordonia liuliyuniae]|uniref:MlaD family protein n=1 Tax=Gordonia liuliyuniae TaxID=2911517 RepID=A0ABS9IN84_9ACTN|nr:MlaD family protein [Gordonia liuliyuniae]MCF8587022.1 MlaD family protein [Gordonia liuliyuniae]